MQMIMDFLKETIQLIILIMVVGILIRFFLRRTLIGRLILLVCKDIHLSLKLCFRISRHTIRIIHRDAKRLNNYMYKYYKKYENQQRVKKIKKYNNVIDFKEAKKQQSK